MPAILIKHFRLRGKFLSVAMHEHKNVSKALARAASLPFSKPHHCSPYVDVLPFAYFFYTGTINHRLAIAPTLRHIRVRYFKCSQFGEYVEPNI
eukprot:scaffold34918_cov29-Tisochrysis_lutea.AAC.2